MFDRFLHVSSPSACTYIPIQQKRQARLERFYSTRDIAHLLDIQMSPNEKRHKGMCNSLRPQLLLVSRKVLGILQLCRPSCVQLCLRCFWLVQQRPQPRRVFLVWQCLDFGLIFQDVQTCEDGARGT